jgi:hypothetical protein
MKCSNCDSSIFRTSKLRLLDFARLLFLQYPVRCRYCHERSFVTIFLAYKIHRARKLRRQQEHRPLAP